MYLTVCLYVRRSLVPFFIGEAILRCLSILHDIFLPGFRFLFNDPSVNLSRWLYASFALRRIMYDLLSKNPLHSIVDGSGDLWLMSPRATGAIGNKPLSGRTWPQHGANWPRASVFARSSAPLRQKGNDGAWRSGFIWIPYSSYLRVTMRQSHSSLLNSPTSRSCDMLRRLTKCVEYVIQCTVSAVLVTIIGPKTRSVIETQRGLHGSLMDIPSAVHLSNLGSTLGSISHPPSGINIQHSAQPAAYHFRMECMLPSYIEHTQLKLKSETFYALHLGSTLYLTLNCRHEYVCKCMYACMFICM